MSCRSICEINLEAELFTLQDSNSKLVAALHEANANVEQWKKQLAAYQGETERLREQVNKTIVQGQQKTSHHNLFFFKLCNTWDNMLFASHYYEKFNIISHLFQTHILYEFIKKE